MNIEKLRDALITIRDECASHTICSSCPLSIDSHKCGVLGIAPNIGHNDNYKLKPKNWNIPDIQLMRDSGQ